MNIGLDVHQATIVAAVLDADGKLMMESVIETQMPPFLSAGAGSHWLHFFSDRAFGINYCEQLGLLFANGLMARSAYIADRQEVSG